MTGPELQGQVDEDGEVVEEAVGKDAVDEGPPSERYDAADGAG